MKQTQSRYPTPYDRRSFLGTAARASLLGIAGTAALRSEETKTNKLLAANSGQSRIREARAYAVDRAIYAQVVDENGVSGWGECGHSGGSLVARVVNDKLKKLVVGQDVFAAEPVWSRMFHEVDELGPGGLASQAIAGVDCALWDLRGKLLDLPVYKLIGGKYRDRFPLYGSFSRSKGGGEYRTPEECAAYAAELVGEGFRAIKLRLGIREENQDPADDPALPCARAVRQAIGDDVELYVDANNGYSPMRAIMIGRQLMEECNVTVFEEPVAALNYHSLSRVCEALPMFIACGEHEYTKGDFRDLILQGRCHILNPDVSKVAGLTEAKKVAALAEAFDLPISVHNARPTLLTAAHFHYVASCQGAHRPQEHPGSRRLSELWKYFENKIKVEDGYGYVPEAPGLGLVVNEKAIKDAAR